MNERARADREGIAAGQNITDSGIVSGDGNNHASVNLRFAGDWPESEYERRQWMIVQIAELRNALIGDRRYGVDGLVDSVHKLRIGLIVLMVLVGLLFILMLYQQYQIYQIFQQIAGLMRIP